MSRSIPSKRFVTFVSGYETTSRHEHSRCSGYRDTERSETLLYPMDALLLAAADAIDAILVSFDNELVDHGAKLPANVI